MPMFELEQYELYAQKYRVEAPSEAEAIKKLLDGEAHIVEGDLEYIECPEDYGMSLDDDPQLRDQLLDFLCVQKTVLDNSKRRLWMRLTGKYAKG